MSISLNKLIKAFFPLTGMVLFLCSGLSAQTRVTGKVLDATTQEPLPFVNVGFKGTRVGASTDIDGNYSLTTNEPTDSVVASYIGYKRGGRAVKQGTTQVLNIVLKPDVIGLQEVVIKPGENPAHRILRAVIARKDKNDRDKLDAYQYETYNKIEFDLNNISEEFKKKKFLKPFKFIFENIDSTNIHEKPSLPIMMMETLSDYYYKRSPRNKKEVIKASKIAGLENESVSQFMGDMYQRVNIYDNTILVLGKNFISPISDHGLFFYRYYLIDSVYIGNNYCYQLQFKPKRKQEFTFEGNMWITDTTFAVRRLEMSIASDANINFVRAMSVVQDYMMVDSAWMLSKDKLVMDIAMSDKKMGIYGRKSTSYKNFVINKAQDDNFYSRTDNLIVDEGAYKKPDEFWEQARHDTLSKNEKVIYHMVDTLQTLPIYKTWVDIITIFVSGYKVVGKFEFGPYYNTLSFNTVEGTRVRLGGRTSNAFSKWYELNGYGAYGFRDEKFKYSIGFRSFITKKPRQLVSGNYKNDYEVLGQSQNAFTQDNILASLLRRTPLSKLTGVEQVSTSYEREWFKGFINTLTVVNRKMTPIGTFRYEFYDKDSIIGFKKNIITSEIKLGSRFAYDEKYIEGEFSRTSLGTKFPILQVQYTVGLKDVFQSDYNYQKISVNVTDRFRINPIGYTDYMIEYGKIFGQLPYPLLELHGGNETYTYDPYAFNMMNYYEFASDEYQTISVFHHFDGFFFNKVPLFRKLKWREVVTAKVLFGKVSEKNKKLLIFPESLTSLDHGPYYEASAGIENIFKIFRVDALWRLSYLDRPNIAKFGIRGAIQLSF
jgi:hypothetical protein